MPAVPPLRHGRHAPPGSLRRRAAAAVGVVATAATIVGIAAPLAAAAVTSNDLLPGSRITLSSEASATAKHQDTLYLGGGFQGIGYRSAGVAATDAATGALDRSVPELVSGERRSAANATRVVADGSGGVYALGLASGPGAFGTYAPPSIGGLAANWVHFDATGVVDAALPVRFTHGAGDDERIGRIYAVAVAKDGTTYASGDFTAVDGQARAGLAAIRPDGTLAPWAPTVQGGAVGRLEVVGNDVLLVGGVPDVEAGGAPLPAFTSVGGQERAGLALVSGETGSPAGWRPDGLSAADAAEGLAVDGTTLYLATSATVRAVGTSGTGAVRDLGLNPQGDISAIAVADGTVYVAGGFDAIGSQATQPARRGLAAIDPATGRTTAWAPETSGRSDALAVVDDRVYSGGSLDACAKAFSRTTGATLGWDPRLGSGGVCDAATSLVATGSRVWAAGSFTTAGTVRRDGFAAVDLRKDEILDWAPRAGESTLIEDLAVSPDAGTVYIAGSTGTLTSINGVPRRGAAAVAATGAARSADDVRAWDPAPDGAYKDVREVQPVGDGSTVLIGGSFTGVDGQDRPHLAATAAATGKPTAWRPAPDGEITALEVAGDGSVYVGGAFTRIGSGGGTARRFLAAFADATAAQPTAWDPALSEEAGGDVEDLALGEGVVYAAGSFAGRIGGRDRVGVAALDRTSGQATAWDAAADATVQTVSTGADGTVYLGAGSGFRSVQGKSRGNGLASVTAAGAVTNWNPGSLPEGESPQYEGVGFGYAFSGEIQEVAGQVVVPAFLQSGFAGLPQTGFLSFGTASAPPTVTTPPSVTGRRVVGARVTCKAGVYGGGSVSRRYVWLRDTAVIPGQTGATYVIRDADVGKELACRETAENAVGPVTTTSAAVRIVGAAPTSDVPPSVDPAAPRAGQTVTCTEGFWSNAPSSYTYRWLRDGVAISGATAATYAVTAADAGKSLACEVTASNDAGASTPTPSAAVRVSALPVETPGGQDPPRQDPPGGTPPNQPGTNPPGPGTNPPGPGPKGPGPKAPAPAGTAKVSLAAKATGGKGRTLVLTVSPSAAGRVTVSASTGKGKNRVAVGSGRATAKKAGALKVTVKPSSTGKRALKAGRSIKVTFRVTFTAADGSKASVTKTIKVKIKR